MILRTTAISNAGQSDHGTRRGRSVIPLATTLTAMLLACSPLSIPEVRGQEVNLVEWVETNDFNAQDRIALGYPPPIPVNTPLPFDGFRSYEGLRARHMDLAENTPWAHAHMELV